MVENNSKNNPGASNSNVSWDESALGCQERANVLKHTVQLAYVATDKYLTIRDANKRFNKLFFTYPSRYMGKHLATIIGVEDFKQFAEKLLRSPKTSGKHVKKFKLPPKTNQKKHHSEEPRERVIQFYYFTLETGGFLFFFYEQQQQVSSLNSISSICATLSKELRKPADLITSLTGGPEQRIGLSADDSKSIRVASLRLQNQVLQLEKYAELHQELAFEKKPVSVNEAMDLALERMNGIGLDTNIELLREIQPQADIIAGEQGLLVELFYQLLHNAWKFKHFHEKCKVYLQATKHDGHNTIMFRDSGIGIEPELKERIFDPFFQGPQTADKYGGMGLGLSIVRRIVELHEGEIVCDGSHELSACFHIRMPLAATAATK